MLSLKTVDTVERERERERVEFRKTTFFYDAKKEGSKLVLKRINICIDKAGYRKALGMFYSLMFSDNLFFR